MRVDLSGLLLALENAEAEKTFEEVPIPEYVRTHIYEPLVRDGTLLFAELDFDAFDRDDLRVLNQYLSEIDTARHRLFRLNLHFCEALPVSRATRSFC